MAAIEQLQPGIGERRGQPLEVLDRRLAVVSATDDERRRGDLGESFPDVVFGASSAASPADRTNVGSGMLEKPSSARVATGTVSTPTRRAKPV